MKHRCDCMNSFHTNCFDLQDNISAAASQAKEKMSAKGDKNKAAAQTSAYNTRSKAANKLDPHT